MQSQRCSHNGGRDCSQNQELVPEGSQMFFWGYGYILPVWVRLGMHVYVCVNSHDFYHVTPKGALILNSAMSPYN